MRGDELLHRLQVADADGVAGPFRGKLRQRAEDGLHGWREKVAIVAQALEAPPNETEELFLKRRLFRSAVGEFFFGLLQRGGDERGGDGFFTRKIIEERAGGD